MCILQESLETSLHNLEETAEGKDSENKSHFKKLTVLLNDKDEKLHSFCKSVCSIAWQMTLQQPPMKWDVRGIGEKPKESHQTILPYKDMDFKRTNRMVVSRYLEPTLTHGDTVLVKGRVFCSLA